MRLNKLLVVSTLALPTVVAPITMTTSCSNAWGHKAPISIGSIDPNNENNPYVNFVNSDLKDADGLTIGSYLPSNYILDAQTNTYYEYATPVSKWTKTENNQTKKLPTTEWVDGSSGWYSPTSNFSDSITETVEDGGKKYSITQVCAKNVTLTANTSFVTSIAQFINKYVSYAINYATSQVHDDADFATSWGGKIPATTTDSIKVLYEWMFANANAHASNDTEVYLKSTNTNFNFVNFPIPSYKFEEKEGKVYKSPSDATKMLLTGSTDSELGDNAKTIYWTSKQENGSGDDKYTVYTYPNVPVLIRAKNLSQRYINPKKTDSIQVTDYYQNDAKKIKDAIGNTWSSLKEKKIGHDGTPSILKYDINLNGSKEISGVKGDKVDKRLEQLQPKGTDFVAFITYSYVEWAKPNPTLNRNNTVTLSSLQTIMPAYIFDKKADLYKQFDEPKKDNKGWFVDVNKADSYSTQLINLLSRNSNEGRVAKASSLDKDSKAYLEFLNYLLATDNDFSFNFVETTSL